jgi:AbiV family abortive infection protein
MDEKSPGTKELRLRQHCLDHARDLIAAAERVFANDEYANIAYHLAILALEEIGKAGMIGARAVIGARRDSGWMEKRFDDHVWKLMWAVWSAGLSSDRIDPKDFEDARRFAASTHRRRLAGLYVDVSGSEEGGLVPRAVVKPRHAKSVVNLARTRLELEVARGTPIIADPNENVAWFLDTMSDKAGARRMLSKPFTDMHEQLKGDTRAWVAWCREEFAKIAAIEDAKLKEELARAASPPETSKPKWEVRVRLVTLTHSIRPKALTYWNTRLNWMRLSAGGKKDELLLDLTLHDSITVANLFDAGLSFSKLCIAALNIGSLGLFWYDWPRQPSRYYESIRDIDSPDLTVDTHKGRRDVERRVALGEKHLHHAMQCIAAYGSMPDPQAEPIFGPYLHGLVLLSKCDVHLSCEDQAFDAFVRTLRHACKHFGDWDGQEGSFVSSLHEAFQRIVPDEADRNTLFDDLRRKKERPRVGFGDAVAAKRIADLYLVLVADRLWEQRIKSRRAA